MRRRFKDDAYLLENFSDFGRDVFRWMVRHAIQKWMSQFALVAFALITCQILLPAISRSMDSRLYGTAVTAIILVSMFALYVLAEDIIQHQYGYTLENAALATSRQILERTKDLQNLFTEARSKADQAETDFMMDGKEWGRLAMYLTRLAMWIGARMEYLERYVQIELWRTRREWYFIGLAERAAMFLTVIVWVTVSILVLRWPADPVGSRLTVVLSAAAGFYIAGRANKRWSTPEGRLEKGMGTDQWVRHADLDVDDKVADQVRRDKERLVEYRALTRSK